jgi:hypothetical protein
VAIRWPAPGRFSTAKGCPVASLGAFSASGRKNAAGSGAATRRSFACHHWNVESAQPRFAQKARCN